MIENQFYDPFVVESIVQGYHMSAATVADKAAAARELHRLGVCDREVAERLYTTERNLWRLRGTQVEPLGPLPDWCEDYGREWPKCAVGHELTPDNYRERWDGRVIRKECIICVRAKHREANRKYYASRRQAKREWARKHRAELKTQRKTA